MSKLPRFVSEQEEAEFWATHDSIEYLDDTESVDVMFVDARPSEKQVSLRKKPPEVLTPGGFSVRGDDSSHKSTKPLAPAPPDQRNPPPSTQLT